MGGLGNQLFQFAAGRRLASLHRSELVLDLGWFRHEAGGMVTPRRYELDGFELIARSTAIRPRAVEALEAGRRRRFSRLGLEVIRQREGDLAVDERVLNAPDDVLLIGYWQSETYFADVSDAVRDELCIRTAPSKSYAIFDRIIGSSSAVAVHVRRGDYASIPQSQAFHGVLDRDYYRRALAHVAERVPDPVFVAFSDDPDWVERELASELHLTVVSGGDALQELRLMSRCKHYVIANSSFSWWGAWLGEQEESIVVAPQRWFTDACADTRDIVPERWQRL